MTQRATVLLIMPRASSGPSMHEYLRLVGADVHTADSGLEALTQMERLLPDAIVCSAHLEDMSGRELLSIVRSDGQFERVVFLLLDSRADAEFGERDAATPPGTTADGIVQKLLPAFGQAGAAQVPDVSGSLECIDFDEVVLALGQGRRSGLLRVSVLSSDTEVWLSEGQVVNARYGNTYGEPAFHALRQGTHILLNAEYQFSVNQPAQVPRLIETPTRLLLQTPGHV